VANGCRSSAVRRCCANSQSVTQRTDGLLGEVIVSVEQGLKTTSAVNLDHVGTVDRSRLAQYVGHLEDAVTASVCRALAVAVGCEETLERSRP